MFSCKHVEGILEFVKSFNANLASISQDFATYQNFGVLLWTKIKFVHCITRQIDLLYTEFHKTLAIREFTRVQKLIK
jgi:hypothetical protein